MGGQLTRWTPVAASLLGHAALIAILALAGVFAGPATLPDPSVTPVHRAADAPEQPGARLSLGTPGGDDFAPAPLEDVAVALDTADPVYRPYLLGVKRRIWECWNAPAFVAGRSARGTLIVEFTLARSGRLAASGVCNPSGVPALDRAALEAVARAEPFPPLPATIAGDKLRVRARFVYD